ncbi:hypothetical protein KR94_00725, partial [Pantoea ananatis]
MLWDMGQTLRWVALWMLYCAGIGPRLVKISAHPPRPDCIIGRLQVMKVLIDMKVSEVLKASTADDLRKLGSYFELKNSFEQELNNKLEVNGW